MKRCAVALALLSIAAFGPIQRAAAEDVDTEKLYQKVVKSAVFIVQTSKMGTATGSGSLICAEKRLILTNQHVVGEEEKVYIQFPVFNKNGSMMTDKNKYMERIPDGLALIGKVIHRDKSRDLAIVQVDSIPAGTPALPLAKKPSGVGATTWNIGSPGAVHQLFSFTEGKVRARGPDTLKFLEEDGGFHVVKAWFLTTTNPVNPGDSGGPLFNRDGEQVAVTQSVLRSAQQVNNFVDVQEVRSFLDEKKITIKDGSVAPSLAKDKEPKKGGPSVVPPKETVAKPPMKGEVRKDEVVKDVPEVDAAKEKEAEGALKRAELFATGDENRATYIERLKDVTKKYPGTAAAKKAEKTLKDLAKK